MAPDGVVAHFQPTCRSRRALEPACRSPRAGSAESPREISIVVSSFRVALPYLVISGIGIETRV